MNQPAQPRTTTTDTGSTDSAKPYRGRRISWKEFRKLMAEVANDNDKREVAA